MKIIKVLGGAFVCLISAILVAILILLLTAIHIIPRDGPVAPEIAPVTDEIVSIEEVSPEAVERLGTELTVTEETKAVRICSPFGKSPGDTISSIEATTIEGDSAEFGGFKALLGRTAKGPLVIVVMGGIAALAGLVVFVLIDKKTGIIVALGGGALIAIGIMFEQHPWLSLAIPLIAAGAGVWFILRTKRGQEIRAELGLTDKTLRETVKGVQDFKGAEPKMSEPLKVALEGAQDQVSKDKIRTIKNGG